MLELRITLNIVLGYILGIIMGLYCKISIVFFYMIIFSIFQVTHFLKRRSNYIEKRKFKIFSLRRYSRYLKIIFTKRVIIIIVISSIIANSVVLFQNSKYKNLYKELDGKEVKCRCIVVSNAMEKEYKNIYKVRVISVNSIKKKYEDTYLYVSVKKNLKNVIDSNLKYGQELMIKGIFIEPEIRRNYKGFDYKEYLKTMKVYGTIELRDAERLKEKSINSFFVYVNNLGIKIKNNVKNIFKGDELGVFLGIVLGDKSNISKDTVEDFSNSDISHILAVSGMHLAYVIFVFRWLFTNIVGRKYGNIFTSFVIFIYMFITGFTPSVVRAGVTGLIFLLSENFKMRSDTWENMATSMLVMLIYNPFLIKSTSLLLSYAGTIGIILNNKILLEVNKIYWKNIEKKLSRRKITFIKSIIKIRNNKIFIKIEESIILTVSVYLTMLPIMMLIFNKCVFLSIFIAIIVGFVAVPAVVLGILIVIINLFKINIILDALVLIEKFLISIIINLSKFGSDMIFNNINVITPNFLEISIYYITLFIVMCLLNISSKKKLNQSCIRVKNLINLLKYRLNQSKNKLIISIFILVFVFSIIKIIPTSLKVHFIDVGQGDSTLVITPHNKKILIDGGGSSDENFDVGKNTLIPYLLDRRINQIDYILISHFDNDHIGGILTLMSDLKVGKVIVSKQAEDSHNYQEFKKIVREKNIDVMVVKKGDVLKIEEDIKINILWPREEQIKQNVLNNNSIVAKFCYKNFSILFTGDIEEIAENEILKDYEKNENILKSDILKVAHHGSKTSSTKRFIEAVSPGVALIGVGKNNNFGHPSESILELLKSKSVKIYRTDENGEITIEKSFFRKEIIIFATKNSCKQI